MQIKLVIAIVVLFIVVVLGAVLIATPTPALSPTLTPSGSDAEPFVSENVIVTEPLPGGSVHKTFTVRGEARGTWYFEASFPIKIQDPSNNQVGLGIAQAESDWMTTEFVPFRAAVTVENYSGPATLVLVKDNPSGLPENDDAVEFPIVIQ
ncbi:hypothetical protein HYW59_01190 [Candidatus Kaiserbacteria bacterium]|nr:hypothetical protein [Candidatus Kaiserbacteria bacterium]